MTIEAKLDTTNDLLKNLLTAVQSALAMQPAATDKPKAETKKADAAKAEVKTETKKAEPESAKADAAGTAEGPSWNDALEVIKAINSSKAAGHGRDGVLAVVTNFVTTPDAKVPQLQEWATKNGKIGEVLAFAKALLAGTAAGSDDLGI